MKCELDECLVVIPKETECQIQQNGMCTKPNFSSAWLSKQSGNSLCCPHEELLRPRLPSKNASRAFYQIVFVSRLISVQNGCTFPWTGYMGKSVIVVCSATDAGESIELLHVANFTIVHTRGRITNGTEQPTRIHRSMKILSSVESPLLPKQTF